MAITDPLLLPPDVVLVPVAGLSEELRRQLPGEEGDYAITRPRLRTPSRLLDARSAELLDEFRSPCTIVDAVVKRSLVWGTDPETTLEEAFPLLQGLLASGFLVEEGAAEAEGILASYAPGDEIAGFQIIECVHVVEDTELYQVRSPASSPMPVAALKIERARPTGAGQGSRGNDRGAWEREVDVLEYLGSFQPQAAEPVVPRLLGRGEVEGRRWLATEWWPGVDALTAAAELRQAGDRTALLHLCRAILAAYTGLHEQGVVHGDVHPRNVLIAAGGGIGDIRLVDFGLARREGAPGGLERPGRGGIAFFFEPEYARAVRAGEPVPAASPAGEQFAAAALLYLLLSGAHYRDFPLEKGEMMRQIAEEPPLPFAERGAEPWPEAEAVLEKALRKGAEERFGSMAELARALDAVAVGERPADGRSRGLPPLSASSALLEQVLERVAPGGPLWEALPAPPRASVNYGAAGIAHALYRIALGREDAALLSAADGWSLRAAAVPEEEGFYSTEIGITPEVVGPVSAYHTAPGPFAVRALISHARGDLAERREAVASFAKAAREPCENLDLTLGRSGLLLAAALQLDTFGAEEGEAAQPLADLGGELLAGIWTELDALPAIGGPGSPGRLNLGMAHGWAGCLYVSLRWCRSAAVPLPARLEERLAELAETALPSGRGLRWPWYGNEGASREQSASMPGWCNGSAGFVHLWILASRMLAGGRWPTLAEGAAWNTWEAAESGGGNLCCGLAGRAYALLALHRHWGGAEWLGRARALAERAAVEIGRNTEAPDSLYKGAVGVAVLAADLERSLPAYSAAMPFFEEEGWR